MILGVIPARYASQRFPGKPLAIIAGKPMIQRVYERATQSKCLDRVIVATPDRLIQEAVQSFGGEVVMTHAVCQSGTDRVAIVARQFDAEIIVNIQGDEPLLHPEMLDALVEGVRSPAGMATLAHKIDSVAELTNQNTVKVVFAVDGRALYFSRSPIPFISDPQTPIPLFKHVGLYAYQREVLLTLVNLPVSLLERSEQLEQLRALENGISIKVIVTDHQTLSVDLPADVVLVERLLKGRE
jgi:3-deoxy-manno-octulosonate cytidylyltransferase (CMP-KDO synthetase)